MVLADVSGAAQVSKPMLVSIQTPRSATQTFILMKVDHPVASVILFAGGYGLLGLKSASSVEYGEGFLVRSRAKFADHNFMVAVVDAPSDQQQGMNGAHAGDIGAVAAYLKEQAGVPVWPSMGTFSAAHGAIAAPGIDGLVLTSTVTRGWRGPSLRATPTAWPAWRCRRSPFPRSSCPIEKTPARPRPRPTRRS